MKKFKIIYFSMLLILIIATFVFPTSTSGGGAESVSLINLIATPEKFHDKRIRIVGYLIIQFEGDAIYLSKEDADYQITKNALALIISEAEAHNYEKYSEGYVILEGKFDANNHGHLALFSGAIKEITRSERLAKRPMPAEVIEGGKR